MKLTTIILSVALILSIVGCTSDNTRTEKLQYKTIDNVKVSYISIDDTKAKELQKKGSVIVKLATLNLGRALKKAMKEKGPEGAIDFCKLNAIKITDSLAAAEGVTIRRLAKKNRNPKNETNPVESKIYKQYIVEWLGNSTLKPKIAINAEGNPVYYKPIILNSMCLICHGEPGKTMPTNISEKIAELYPNDKAIDFKDGQPRGMWAITFDKIKVSKN